jgi:hypothetical protein
MPLCGISRSDVGDVASEGTATRRWRAVLYGMLFVFGLGLALVLGYCVRHFPGDEQVGTENAVGTTTPTPAWLWIVGASALGLSGTLFCALNSIVPSDIGSGCLPTLDQARYTAIVFAIGDHDDVDLWLKDWYGCPEVGNGVRTSGLLINGQGDAFLAELDTLAPRAPGQDA